jgi:7-cyano-7-deazaguanine synthase
MTATSSTDGAVSNEGAISTDGAIGLLLSGGLDSSILMGHLLDKGRRVQPFYVRSQLLWEKDELRAAQAYLEAVARDGLEPLVMLEMPLGDLYENHWSTNGRGTPDAGSADDAVYLPGRNALLTIKPALWCAMHGIGELALAVLASNPFADATTEFFDEFSSALNRAVGGRVNLARPFAELRKDQVMRLAGDLPLELTFSCIAPVGRRHCGRCNKCAERQRAFRSVGLNDPTEYANREANAIGGKG